MRLLILILITFFYLVASAEVITMDLTTATDMSSSSVQYSNICGAGYYDVTDVWDGTYNDDSICQLIYTNEARFMLSHLPSQNSYGGMSWEGFTLSKVSKDTANVFGCVANGGLAGVGTPYVIGYFSDWVTEALGYSSNIILFDQEYYPDHVYICQNSNTMKAISEGGVFNARVFDEKDTLALIISAIDSTFQETISTTYYLAVDGKKNNGWVEVPLNTLGKTIGLSFRMTTTDVGQFGMNTPLYFALDALTVNTEPITAVENIHMVDSRIRKTMQNGQLLLIHSGSVYTITGQRLYKN